MGSLNCYRFLPDLSLAMKAFNNVLKLEKFEWGDLKDKALEMFK